MNDREYDVLEDVKARLKFYDGNKETAKASLKRWDGYSDKELENAFKSL